MPVVPGRRDAASPEPMNTSRETSHNRVFMGPGFPRFAALRSGPGMTSPWLHLSGENAAGR
jgi:hypothetical protein